MRPPPYSGNAPLNLETFSGGLPLVRHAFWGLTWRAPSCSCSCKHAKKLLSIFCVWPSPFNPFPFIIQICMPYPIYPYPGWLTLFCFWSKVILFLWWIPLKIGEVQNKGTAWAATSGKSRRQQNPEKQAKALVCSSLVRRDSRWFACSSDGAGSPDWVMPRTARDQIYTGIAFIHLNPFSLDTFLVYFSIGIFLSSTFLLSSDDTICAFQYQQIECFFVFE